ncbi:3-phenylpropionate MFS transporter [Magnetospirillum sp. UT-4]|uniref:3-phenylpropionate MFS transporter n=1 Tax=Magnetospirillum sp. UT-4 TaxID=2681467 RepID=UPI0013845FE1|nr:3-phenylpropionate MFS transporter [Magnetospirillum sp. UT-4]CAA7620392.1 Permeases of the major facilitator superfamily [Magnetospirillum sp. UT-4]
MTFSGAGLRLSAYYVALFAAVGIHLPFWPLWLEAKGLTATEIGLVIASTFLVKVAVNPLVGHAVDRRGDRRKPMLVLALGATLAWTGFAFAEGFWQILGVTIAAVGLWSGIMPVGESLAMMVTQAQRLDYGRIRLWGSLAFIVAAVLVGRLLEVVSPLVLVWLIGGALGATALSCATLPDARAHHEEGTERPRLTPLLGSSVFLLFATASALNHASHTVYYGFATLSWKQAGISDSTIGLLWSEGVLAEIVLFAFSGRAVARFGPAGLLLAAAGCGVARWLVLGLTASVPVLAMAQLLHAATFGCAHLGAMHFIQRAVPAGLSARAQAVYSALAMGVAPGLMSPLAGALFQQAGALAFLAMAALSLLATAAALGLMRRWHGGRVC